ncbi:MAG: sigma-70 family RNA polymerase sigma factor [Candidatus Limiplasma sp.]|nr:sigma-70 family RNA polymerase sigma factor [Candidatus Limiplasma sp.]
MSEVKVPDETHEAELSRWMNDYGDMLVRLAYGILKDSFLAQDAAQDTFVKAYKSRGSFRGECSEKTYLTGILMNTCRDYLRTAWMKRMDRKTPLEQLPEPYADAPMPDRTVMEAVLALSMKLRQVILLRYWQNMKIKEIGEALCLSPETVKKRLKRANQKLRTQLEGWYYDE